MRLLTHSCQPISTLFWELGLPPPFGVQSNDQAQRRGRIAKKSISRLFRVRCSALLGVIARRQGATRTHVPGPMPL